jgi:lysozyme
MRARLSVTRSAVDLIKVFEGFRATAARLDDGRWTIGYGHTLTAREGAVISESDAEALLLYDLIQASHAVNEYVFAPLTQNQFDALVSFVFNIGTRAFRGSPTLRRLNEGRPLEAALAMELWRKADLEGERIVVDALVRRRAAEKALFLKPDGGWMPAPSPLLAPKLDYDAVGLIPLTTPVETRAAMNGDRAFAERKPDRPVALSPEPSASEAAAAAVIERLESIFAEPEPAETKPAASKVTPLTGEAPEPLTMKPETPEMPPLRDSLHSNLPPITFLEVSAPRRRWVGPLIYVVLGIIGFGLLALAGIWGVRPRADLVLGFTPKIAALSVGIAGFVCASVSVYFLLERIGLPKDRRPG